MTRTRANPAEPELYLNGATLMTTSTDRLLEVARAAGFRGVEPRAERLLSDPGELQATVAAVRPGEAWGLNGVSIHLLPGGALDRSRLSAELERRLKVCAALGAPYLLAVPPVPPGPALADVLEAVREGLELAQAMASAAGCRVAFEFLAVPGCPVNTPGLAATTSAGLEGVDLVLDSHHWHLCGRPDLADFPIERLAMVHLNDLPNKPAAELTDAARLLPGQGVLPLGALVRGLEERGYGGPYSLETFNPDHWAADPGRLASEGFAALSALLGGAWA